MALVTFNRADLENLVKKKLTEKDYKEVIPMMGTPLKELRENDVDFEIFPNRPDLLSVEGFARAVQGFLGLKKGIVKYKINPSKYEVHVDRGVLDKRGCAAFAVVKGIRFTDETVAEFMQLQDKLTITIGRHRKKSAMGSYDLDDINFPVKYTEIGPNHKFVPLLFNEEVTAKELETKHPRGIEYKHIAKGWKNYVGFIDAKKNTMAVLPYTNAQFAKIKPETKNLFIEVTGTEWKAVVEMLNVVVSALADRGGKVYAVKTVYPGKKVVNAPKLNPWRMKLDINYVNKLLDLDLKPVEVKAALEKMRFGMSGRDVLVPAYRTDILHQIDLVEDICIVYGYEKFEPRIPKLPTIGQPNEKNEFCSRLREVMIGLGFQEVVNFILSNPKKEFDMIRKKLGKVVEIQQSKTEEYTITRVSLIPSLLGTIAGNASAGMPQRIFEVGTVIEIDEKSETGAVNVEKLGAAIVHSSANYSEMRAHVETLFRNLGVKFEIEEAKNSSFIEGRAVNILVKGKSIGVLGEIHPEVLSNFKIEYPVVVFEVEIDPLLNAKNIL